MNKKGVELTLNVVIIAVILLVTMGAVIYYFLTQTEEVRQAVNDCQSKQGTCVASAQYCISQGGAPLPFNCKKGQPPTCCLKLSK